MKNLKRFLRIVAFVCLILFAMVGIGIPIPVNHRDRFDFHVEQMDESKKDKGDSDLFKL